MKIRNFSIVAHIDHGKTTLSDRILEDTGTVPKRKMQAQLLDGMDLERERGITIKAKAVRIKYKDYILNLIDTPGHVDFSYEVARSLRACEGVLLLVDASQGVEAQTVAHAHLAKKLGLTIIPVMNKVDLSQSDADASEEQLWDILGEPIEAERVSAKTGLGIEHLLDRIIADIPAPQGDENAPVRALIFDSFYDAFRGVIMYVRMVDGTVKPGQTIRFMSSGATYKIEELGYMTPKQLHKDAQLSAGEVGYLVAGIKDIHQVKVGDTVTLAERPAQTPLPGYEDAKPVVFASIFPIETTDFPLLRTALEKLNLSDSSFHYQSETSKALGFGFRLGFMGILHIEIVKERLEREFNLSLIATSPNVVYHVKFTPRKTHPQELSALPDATDDPGYKIIDNPANFPPHGDIIDIKEPVIHITIVTPVEFMDGVMTLLKEKRGTFMNLDHLSNQRVIVKYEMPMGEMVIDFYNKLKSVSKGYASFDYGVAGFRSSDVVLMEILLHGTPVDALSVVVHKDKAQTLGRALCAKLKELIGRQQFEVAVQAAVNGKVIARETIPAFRKDVIAKCYGGDISRKRKLLEKQKEGKKRMKSIGSLNIPQEAFVSMLKISEE